jgi:hypothetical protein
MSRKRDTPALDPATGKALPDGVADRAWSLRHARGPSVDSVDEPPIHLPAHFEGGSVCESGGHWFLRVAQFPLATGVPVGAFFVGAVVAGVWTASPLCNVSGGLSIT